VRFEADCEQYSAKVHRVVCDGCKKCHGARPDDCGCGARSKFISNAYEACIPKDFWKTKPDDVEFNKEVFEAVVLPYVEKLWTARRRGYGLLLLGDNGVGKTMFISYTLAEAIRRHNFSTYYTTIPSLDHWLKRGFSDRTVMERLDYMLTSDFLAIDELGKERTKEGDNWMRLQIERILKDRFDNSLPTLIATNADPEALTKMYGSTIGSILAGKFKQVAMEPGNFRDKLRRRMDKEMGK
jgi:DNA replication protein DnaC